MGGFVVGFYWSGRFSMAHFNKGCVDGNSLLDVEEYRTGFNLGSGCHDGADCLALGEDWSVWIGIRSEGGGWSSAQVVMARSTTAFFGMNKIPCVTVNVDTHVASMKTGDIAWLGGSVFYQHLCLFDVSVVVEAFSDPMSLSATSMVGSMAREM